MLLELTNFLPQQEKLYKLFNKTRRTKKFNIKEIMITLFYLIKFKRPKLKVSLKMDDQSLFKIGRIIFILIYRISYQEI